MKQVKSKSRVVKYGEVFTNKKEVESMINLIPNTSLNTTFLEPACGNGNFVIEIFKRKMKIAMSVSKDMTDFLRNILIAVSSIYAVDIQKDNVDECKQRIYKQILRTLKAHKISVNEEFYQAVELILSYNVICGNTLSAVMNNGDAMTFSEWNIDKNFNIIRKEQDYNDMIKGTTKYISYENYSFMNVLLSA